MSSSELTLPAAGTVIMFSTAWCGYCRRLKTYLDVSQIRYREVNIEETPEAVAFVEGSTAGTAPCRRSCSRTEAQRPTRHSPRYSGAWATEAGPQAQ